MKHTTGKELLSFRSEEENEIKYNQLIENYSESHKDDFLSKRYEEFK